MGLYFIVGFMGSGKTYFGKNISVRMGLDFIDLDKEIERRQCKSISAIFYEQGESVFREIEKDVLRSINTECTCIVSVGGGTPCFHGNMEYMLSRGKVIYIKRSIEELVERLKNTKVQRPLLAGCTEGELRQRVYNLLRDREKYYEQADLIV